VYILKTESSPQKIRHRLVLTQRVRWFISGGRHPDPVVLGCWAGSIAFVLVLRGHTIKNGLKIDYRAFVRV
jgi:hypothetical protein